MDLAIRYTWLVAATLILMLTSIILLFTRRYSIGVYRYNNTVIRLLGVEENHPKWSQWVIRWFVSSSIATFQLSLLINTIDTFLLITGQTGISLDPVIMPVAILVICTSIFLLIAATFPVIATFPACPTALVIMTALHIYGFHYVTGLPLGLYDALAYGITFLYFLVIAIGIIGTFLSVFVLLRFYIIIRITALTKRGAAATSTSTAEK